MTNESRLKHVYENIIDLEKRKMVYSDHLKDYESKLKVYNDNLLDIRKNMTHKEDLFQCLYNAKINIIRTKRELNKVKKQIIDIEMSILSMNELIININYEESK